MSNLSTHITENSGEGTDTISLLSYTGNNITFTLTSNVENLIVGPATGSFTSLTANGNSLDNVLTDNTTQPTHVTLAGGAGNDTYVIQSSEHVVEGSGAGTDTVMAGTSYTLGSNLENLSLTGSSAINGTGNTLDNIIIGNSAANTLSGSSGNDTLDGGGGLDSLTGGTGTDTFVFHSATAFNNIDVVTDFHTSESDKINIADLLTGYNPGSDNIDDFVQLVTSGSNMLLKVDVDGTGGGNAMTQIATLVGVSGLNVDTLVANGELIVS